MKKVFRALHPKKFDFILFSGTEYFRSVPDESANFPRSHAGKLVLIRDSPFPRDTMIAAWKYHITIKGTLTITYDLFCLLHICFWTCLDRKFFSYNYLQSRCFLLPLNIILSLRFQFYRVPF